MKTDDMSCVFGFEFSKKRAKKIRNDETALRILSELELNGVAIIRSEDYPNCLKSEEGNYWDIMYNDTYTVFIPTNVKIVEAY